MRKHGLSITTGMTVFAVICLFALVRFDSHPVSAANALAFSAPAVETSPADPQQYPIMDKVADKLVQKYQTASCEQLWMERSQKTPKSPEQQEAIQILRDDQKMRAAFLNKVAAPIANKMFECGMIP